jgi:hypothetical protein
VDWLIEYWESSPPVHILVKGLMGIESKPKSRQNIPTEDELKHLAAQFNQH